MHGTENFPFEHDGSLVLRPAEKGELLGVARDHARIYAREHGFGEDFEAYVLRGMVTYLEERHRGGSEVWVVTDGHTLAGSIGMVRHSAEEVQLRWFLVQPEFRGQGWGEALLRRALEFAREQGYGKIFLWTVTTLEEARKLYARHGFHPVESVTHHLWGRDLVEERWDLELPPERFPLLGHPSLPSDREPEGSCPLSHLQRRKIQAPGALALLRAFEKHLGAEKAREVASAGIAEDARASGAARRNRREGAPLEVLARVVREEWAAEGALDLAFFEETPTRLRFDVLRCAYAELYEGLGAREQGFCLSCARDEAFARGLDPRLRLKRRSTIMEGAPRCDFLFFLEDPFSGTPARDVQTRG